MEPTVELAINSSTGTHKIEIVFDTERYALEPSEAARLGADLSTVLAFTLGGSAATEEEPKRISAARLSSVPASVSAEVDEDTEPEVDEEEEEHEPVVPKVVWHRREQGSGQYVADLPIKDKRGRKVTALAFQKPNQRGWNVRVGGKVLNDAPLAMKRDAYDLVAKALKEQTLTV